MVRKANNGVILAPFSSNSVTIFTAEILNSRSSRFFLPFSSTIGPSFQVGFYPTTLTAAGRQLFKVSTFSREDQRRCTKIRRMQQNRRVFSGLLSDVAEMDMLEFFDGNRMRHLERRHRCGRDIHLIAGEIPREMQRDGGAEVVVDPVHKLVQLFLRVV